jgi:hypothetical protein
MFQSIVFSACLLAATVVGAQTFPNPYLWYVFPPPGYFDAGASQSRALAEQSYCETAKMRAYAKLNMASEVKRMVAIFNPGADTTTAIKRLQDAFLLLVAGDKKKASAEWQFAWGRGLMACGQYVDATTYFEYSVSAWSDASDDFDNAAMLGVESEAMYRMLMPQ